MFCRYPATDGALSTYAGSSNRVPPTRLVSPSKRPGPIASWPARPPNRARQDTRVPINTSRPRPLGQGAPRVRIQPIQRPHMMTLTPRGGTIRGVPVFPRHGARRAKFFYNLGLRRRWSHSSGWRRMRIALGQGVMITDALHTQTALRDLVQGGRAHRLFRSTSPSPSGAYAPGRARAAVRQRRSDFSRFDRGRRT